MCWSLWAAPKYHRWGQMGAVREHLFLIQRLGVQEEGAGRSGVWESLPGLSTVPSHCPRLAERQLWFLLSLPGRHSHHGGPTHWTSSPPNHLPWAPQPIPPHGVGAGALSYGLGGGCSVHSTKWISCYGGPRSGHTCPSGQCHGNTQTDAVECLYFFHGGFVPAHKMRQKPKPDKQKGSINC